MQNYLLGFSVCIAIAGLSWWVLYPAEHVAHQTKDHRVHTMTIESERAFVAEMIPHHQEAVDAARIVRAQGGTTPAVRELAQNIINTQTEEIIQLQTLYETWYGTPARIQNYQPMMRPLTSLSGVALDRAFLSDMIIHHEGAISMAQTVQPHITKSEIATLADAIVATQRQEISLMQELLTTLPLE